MKSILVVIDLFNQWLFNFIAVLFGLISLLTIYQVFSRYVLKSPLVWSEAVVRYLMIWIVLLGIGIAIRKGSMISVEILLHIVPKRVRRIMRLFIILINIVFLSLLIKYGFDIMTNLAHQKTGTLNIPVSWIYAAIPVGSGLALLNCIAVGIEWIMKTEKGDEDGNVTIC